MQAKHQEYVAVLLSESNRCYLQLFPLTKDYPICLLPIGNKPLIVYQLEALALVPRLQKIIVVYSEKNSLTQTYVEEVFMAQYREYPVPIVLHRMKESHFSVLQDIMKDNPAKSYLVLQCDTLSSIGVNALLAQHQNTRADLTLLLKQKKEFPEQDKKVQQADLENDLDNVLLSEQGQLIFIDMTDEIDNNGIKIDSSIYRQVKRASFKKVVDAKMYVMSPHLARILCALKAEQVIDIKPELIKIIVENQTNQNFLAKDEEVPPCPLRVFALLAEQDAYIRKVNSKRVYEQLNFDSLIRGGKQKAILLPNSYSCATDEQYAGNASLCKSSQVEPGLKLRRSCVGAYCRIGHNVELINSIIMDNVQIKDNCKISESILGNNTMVGEGAVIKNSYTSINCRIADGARLEGATLIDNPSVFEGHL